MLSEPSGAAVSTSDGMNCTTPCTLKRKRKTEFDVTVSLAGYKSKTVRVESKMKGGGVAAGAGNVIAGGIIGGIVDGNNGSMKNLMPNPLKIQLAAEGSSQESTVVEATKDEIPKKAKRSKKSASN